VGTIPGALEFVSRPTGEDIAAMIDVVLEQCLEVEDDGRPSTSASEITPKVVCRAVCL